MLELECFFFFGFFRFVHLGFCQHLSLDHLNYVVILFERRDREVKWELTNSPVLGSGMITYEYKRSGLDDKLLQYLARPQPYLVRYFHFNDECV